MGEGERTRGNRSLSSGAWGIEKTPPYLLLYIHFYPLKKNHSSVVSSSNAWHQNFSSPVAINEFSLFQILRGLSQTHLPGSRGLVQGPSSRLKADSNTLAPFRGLRILQILSLPTPPTPAIPQLFPPGADISCASAHGLPLGESAVAISVRASGSRCHPAPSRFCHRGPSCSATRVRTLTAAQSPLQSL